MMNPPIWPIKWLKRLLLPEFSEHLEGDLNELFEDRLESYSPKKARRLFYWDCLQLMRPALMKSIVPRSNFTIMFRNHFKIGYRNLLRHKSYTALNLLGLTLGLTASTLLYRVIAFEKSFDSFHENIDNLYHIAENGSEFGIYYQTRTPAAEALKASIPEVTQASRIFYPDNKWFSYNDKRLNYGLTFVDEDFATMFSFQVIEGNLQEALASKDHIVITLDISKAFFGYEDAVGKVLTSIDGKEQFIVGAVIEDPPANSTIDYEVIQSWSHIPTWIEDSGDWHNTFMTALIQLQDGIKPTDIQDKLNQVSAANFLPEGSENYFHLVSFGDLYSITANNDDIIGLLLTISLAISLIAFVNFLNLSSAQSLNRLKEVGIRKVMGSTRPELIVQFAIESVMVCILSAIVAFALSLALIPHVNEFFGLSLRYAANELRSTGLLLLGAAFLIGVAAGLYPSLYLAGKDVITSLKGDAKKGSARMIIQKTLIILQYVASVFLIAGTAIVWKQINFMKSQKLNVDTEQVLVLEPDYSSFGSTEIARKSVKKFVRGMKDQSFIRSSAFASNAPGAYWENYNNFEDVAGNSPALHLRQTTFSSGVAPTLNIEIVRGRNIDDRLASDSIAVLINESAFEAFGWADLENKKLRPSGDQDVYKVVGVLKDYHYQALNGKIEPLIHWNLGADQLSYRLLVRYFEGKASQTLDYLKEAWKETGSFVPLDYYFLDEGFDKLYKEQERIGSITASFALVAIVLASLGLFALASYMIRQRRKEIGIRKVMGASNRQITLKLSSNFVGLVLAAIVISIPLIWYVSDRFLQDFSYRITPGPEIYGLAAFSALLMAVASVSIRAFLAAADDPTHSLRDE